jgi:hypothetical protein
MREHKRATAEKQQRGQADHWGKHNAQWFRKLCAIANEAQRIAEAVDLDECTPEQLENLLKVIDPLLVSSVVASGTVLVSLARDLQALLAQKPEAAGPEDSPPIALHEEATTHAAA